MPTKKEASAKPKPVAQSGSRPKWRKAPDELVAFFNATMVAFPAAEMRKMFGYPCAFINGNLATGLNGDAMMLRLSPADLGEFMRIDGASAFEPMPGRPMRGYVTVPDTVRRSPDLLQAWIAKALEYTAALPAKAKKGRFRKSG